jgi:predicted acylesterase/phospholipase RssA
MKDNNLPAQRADECIALVLQGGGALGAYQVEYFRR